MRLRAALEGLSSRGLRSLSRVMAVMWLTGGLLVLSSVVLLRDLSSTDRRGLLAIGVLALLTALMTRALAAVLPAWCYRALSTAGVVAITGTVVFSGAQAPFELLYVWVVILAALHYGRTATVVLSVLSVLGYALGLWFLGLGVLLPALALAVTNTVAAAVIGWLSRASMDARVDALTGIANRRELEARLAVELDRSGAADRPLCVALVDVDHFKEVNDARGHAAGDELLRRLVSIWRANMRDTDLLARLGGDEFAVVLPGVAVEHAGLIVERLRELSSAVGANCSAGVAPCLPGDSVSNVLRRADAALYEAKRAGRAQTATTGEGWALGAELDRALETGEIEVHYQPVMRLEDDCLHGFEALVRWRHPTRGLVRPDQFIPAAEQSGRIDALGAHVLRTACEQLAAWRARDGASDLRVAVNVSALELATGHFADRVAHALDRAGLPGDALVLEITESAMVGSSPAAMGALDAMRELGVHLSMDDFGTGYSSLSQLRAMPVAGLKIDRDFIEDVDRTAEARSLVAAIVGLAHGLELGVVAEGIERPTQLDAVRAVGCDLAQGYLLGRPAPADQVERHLPTVVATPPPATGADRVVT